MRNFIVCIPQKMLVELLNGDKWEGNMACMKQVKNM
jgi:hypothetical protein